MARRKKVKVASGDVFAIPLGNNKYSYGQVIGETTFVIYDYTSETHPNVSEIVRSKIIIFTHSVDAAIEDGDWELIGNTDIPSNIIFPEYIIRTLNGYSVIDFESNILRSANEIEREQLSHRKSVSPSVIEKAVKTYYGVEDSYSYLEKLRYKY